MKSFARDAYNHGRALASHVTRHRGCQGPYGCRLARLFWTAVRHVLFAV